MYVKPAWLISYSELKANSLAILEGNNKKYKMSKFECVHKKLKY